MNLRIPGKLIGPLGATKWPNFNDEINEWMKENCHSPWTLKRVDNEEGWEFILNTEDVSGVYFKMKWLC